MCGFTVWSGVCVVFLSLCVTTDAYFQCQSGCSCTKNLTQVQCASIRTLQVSALPSRTKVLVIRDSFLGPLFNLSLSTLAELEYIDLSHNNIKELHRNTLQHLSRLKWLSLHKNGLENFADYQFQFTENIEYLDLSFNRFSVVPDVPFRFLTNLKVLNFSYNQLLSPRLGLRFQTMTNMQTLDFSGNNFGVIPSNAFERARNWQDHTNKALNLSFCDIREIGARAFSYPVGLKSLSLEGNYDLMVENLTAALDSSDLASLRILTLSGMNLTNISDILLTVKNAPLIELYVSRNKITTIPDSLSDFQRNLKVLDASHNKITAIGSSLTQISSLISLDLSHNLISSVEESFGQNLINLQTLILSHNKIGNDMVVIRSMAQLSELDISFNDISVFNVPDTLTNLRRLNMAENKVNSIRKFGGLNKLEHLDMSGNKLTTLESFMFPDSKNIMFVNFSGNLIADADHQTFHLSTPKTIDLSFNRFEKFRNLGWQDVIRIYLRGNRISQIDRQTFYALFHLKELDLSRNNLTGFPWSSFVHLHNLTILNINHNHLSDSGGLQAACASLESLQQLDVGFNNYTSFLKNTFQKNHHLDTLLLNNNHLRSLDPRLFQNLDELTQLDLSDNPFMCDCDLIDFRNWLRHTNLKIIKRTNSSYLCRGPAERVNTRVINFEEGSFECRQTLLYIIIFTSIGVLCVLVGSISFVVCHKYYKWKRNWKAANNGSIHYEIINKPKSRPEKPARQGRKGVPAEYANGFIPRPQDTVNYEVETFFDPYLRTRGRHYCPQMVPLVGMNKSSKKSKNSKNKEKVRKKNGPRIKSSKLNKLGKSKDVDLLKEVRFRNFLRDTRMFRNGRFNPQLLDEDWKRYVLNRLPPYFYNSNRIRRSNANVESYPHDVRKRYESSRQADIVRPRPSQSVPNIVGYVDSLPRRKYPLDPNVIVNYDGDIRHSSADLTSRGHKRHPSLNNLYLTDRVHSQHIPNGERPFNYIKREDFIPTNRYHTIGAIRPRGQIRSRSEWV